MEGIEGDSKSHVFRLLSCYLDLQSGGVLTYKEHPVTIAKVNTSLRNGTPKQLRNKSIQLHTDQEAGLDLNVKLSLKSNNTSWGFWLVATVILKLKIFQHLFVLLSHSLLLPVLGLTGLLEIASVAWGVLLYLPSVQTICTQSGQGAGLVGALSQMCPGTQPPLQAAILFLGLSVSSLFYVPSWWQMCFTSLAEMT